MQDDKGLKNGAEVSLTMGHLKRYVNDRLNTYIDANHLGRSPVLLFHLVLAMGLLYVAENSGQMTKLLMAPYVAHMVLSRRIEYVPALILLSSGTTILSFVVLLSTMGVMLMNWRALMESALRPMVLVTTCLMAICLPMFLLWTVQDGANISALILNLDKFRFFFSIFPLFYGFLLLAPQGQNPQAPDDFRFSKRFDLSIFSLPLSISFLLFIVDFPLVAGTNRILSMFAVLCLAYWALYVSLKPRVIAMPIHFYVLSILYLGHTVLQANIKFNLIFSGLISFLLVFSMVRFHRETVKRWLSGRSIIVASLVFVAIGIYFSSRVDVELTDVDYSDVANYPQFMMQKLFADRGVIWAGAVDTILSSVGLFPQKENILLQYETMAGELFEVDFGAHNIIFELILRLGWVVGFGLIVFLGQLLILLTRTLLQGQKDLHFLFAVALSLSLLLGGGLLGQYIMMPNFAYLMFTLAGLCLSYDNFEPAVREENMVQEDLVQKNNGQDQRIHE